MDWLNYHHLLYFYTVAKEGTVSKACARLHLAQPTISTQLKQFEKSIGEKLFDRVGRRLVLTETGRMVYRYAEEIFSIGKELVESLHKRPSGRPLRFVVGIADAVPKIVAHRLLQAALNGPEPVQLACIEGSPERLLGQLAVHSLDLVISDGPVGPPFHVRAYNHLLLESGIGIYGAASLARKFKKDFPRSLDGAPMLLPTPDAAMRRAIDHWLESHGIRPHVVAEFGDPALMKVFGKSGLGMFPAAEFVADEVKSYYASSLVGRVPEIRQRYFAISAERRLKHPAVLAISALARRTVF